MNQGFVKYQGYPTWWLGPSHGVGENSEKGERVNYVSAEEWAKLDSMQPWFHETLRSGRTLTYTFIQINSVNFFNTSNIIFLILFIKIVTVIAWIIKIHPIDIELFIFKIIDEKIIVHLSLWNHPPWLIEETFTG